MDVSGRCVIFKPGSCGFSVLIEVFPGDGSVLKEPFPFALLFAVFVFALGLHFAVGKPFCPSAFPQSVFVNAGFREVSVRCPTLELAVRLAVFVSDFVSSNAVVMHCFAHILFSTGAKKGCTEGQKDEILAFTHVYNLEKR